MGRALAVLIWLLTFGSVALFLHNNWWFPAAASAHAPLIDQQFILTIIVVGVAFTAAQVGLGWAVWRYRDVADGARASYSHGNNRL
jgi:heme/copper-type cytochrome/quinol oxidase subunit 2